jgi:glyoxylase-like metal-dependent hydrolase (beta-lactamase superfamily II)/rhodanese-related sulfurtransferase
MKLMMNSPITIEPQELRSLLEQHSTLTVLDVRPAEERGEWAIPDSLHVDAYHALKTGNPDALTGLELPPNSLVVTVCGGGKMSLVAAEQLRARGIAARSLSGGMNAWSLAWNTAEVPIPGGTATVVQLRRTGKGCLSYLIGADGDAVVIDASIDPEIYQELAIQRGWKITHILDTHVHADHLSRSRLLSERTGATLHLPETNRIGFPFDPIRDVDKIQVGKAFLTALHTPGHTLESMSYHLDERALFTGDTLFIAGVGRPDLEASTGEAKERAKLLWASLNRLSALSPETLVLPGHTSGPVPFDEQPIVATLGEIGENVAMLQLAEPDFTETILGRIPQTPPNHSTIVAFNETGEFPVGDPTDLEAGANRCAVS